MFVQGSSAGSFFICWSSKQYTFSSKRSLKKKIQGWRMLQSNLVIHLPFWQLCQSLQVSWSPWHQNSEKLTVKECYQTFTRKHSQAYGAWVNSWYKEHHLLTDSILTDPDSFPRHRMRLPDNVAFKEFSFLLAAYRTFHIFCLTCLVSSVPVTGERVNKTAHTLHGAAAQS